MKLLGNSDAHKDLVQLLVGSAGKVLGNRDAAVALIAEFENVVEEGDLLGIVLQPLDLHLVNVGSIPTGPTHGEMRLQPHPEDVLKSAPNVRKSPRSGLNLEGRLSNPQFF